MTVKELMMTAMVAAGGLVRMQEGSADPHMSKGMAMEGYDNLLSAQSSCFCHERHKFLVRRSRLIPRRGDSATRKEVSSIISTGYRSAALRLRGYGDSDDSFSVEEEDDDREGTLEDQLRRMLHLTAQEQNFTLSQYAAEEEYPGYQNPPVQKANDEDWPFDPVERPALSFPCFTS
eukprot:202376-Hanusia_phi.AAC.3